MIMEFKGKRPKIGNNVFIAPNACIIGDVVIEDNASIWFGVVIRADLDRITIGENSNIQDNVTLHTDPGIPAVIGKNVTIGHNAVVHGCIIEDRSLIGINAVVLNGAVVREGSIVAAGSVVRSGEQIGPAQLVAGIPATVKKILNEDALLQNDMGVQHYLSLSEDYQKELNP